jgi:hypothetical protein
LTRLVQVLANLVIEKCEISKISIDYDPRRRSARRYQPRPNSPKSAKQEEKPSVTQVASPVQLRWGPLIPAPIDLHLSCLHSKSLNSIYHSISANLSPSFSFEASKYLLVSEKLIIDFSRIIFSHEIKYSENNKF